MTLVNGRKLEAVDIQRRISPGGRQGEIPDTHIDKGKGMRLELALGRGQLPTASFLVNPKNLGNHVVRVAAWG